MGWRLDNSYARLPAQLFHPMRARGPSDPTLIAVNAPLAARLGLDAGEITAQIATGATCPPGAAPLAQAYAGHQFGNFVPRLGDGRALLLGEQIAPDGTRYDIALKGSGPTPYARGADGLAWLGPVLREYVMSESLAALGLPTTRALAAATTGDMVYRDAPLPGAVLMRVAASHLRVGTVQYCAAQGDHDALRALCDYALRRHVGGGTDPEALLDHVISVQADLIAGWMSVGFIHGVMNTDNMTLSGETIDYGPCAFMERCNRSQVFSSIDRNGRYAYANQPAAAHWNLAELASALVPLMPDQEAAIARFTTMINGFPARYTAAWIARFGAKLGLPDPGPEDQALIEDLIAAMERAGIDFTRGFIEFTEADWVDPAWRRRWQARLGGQDPVPILAQSNPHFIPRLHQIQAAIDAALGGDMAPFEALLSASQTPFTPRTADDPWVQPAPPGQEITRTFCGT